MGEESKLDATFRRAVHLMGAMNDAFRANPDELLNESRWVRELARSLTIDRASADDLVQETWLATLRSAPKQLVTPRAWLARVLFNSARHENRRNALRAEREFGAARAEALPSTVQLAERAELERTIVAAVLALAEPYRSTILWRYFGDLSSEEIARRLDVSASTVRNRLRRGLDLLRSALERQDVSNWEDRCLALAAFSSGARDAGVASSWIKGGIVMGTKARVALGLGATLLASAVLWNEWSAPESPDHASSPPQPTGALVMDSDANKNALGSRDKLPAELAPGIERHAIDGDAKQASQNNNAPAIVFGDVRASEGTPSANGRVELQDEWGDRADSAIVRNAYAIPGLHAGKWKLTLRDCSGCFATARGIELSAGASLRVDIELRRSQSISVRLKTPSGEDIDSSFRDDAWNGQYQPRVEVVATRDLLPPDVSAAELARLSVGTYTSASAAGNSGRVQVPTGFSGVLELGVQQAAFASAMLRGHVLSSAPIEADTRELELLINPDHMLASLGSLRFRMINALTGEPIESAGIQLREASTVGIANPVGYPNRDGVIERSRLPAGTYELQIRARPVGFEHLVKMVTIESGRATDLGDIRLADGGGVRGRVIDEAGAGVSAMLCWSSIDAPDNPNFIEESRSQSDGRFGLGELPAHGVLLRINDPQWALDPVPIHFVPGVFGEVTLTVRPGTPVTLRHRLEGEVSLVLRKVDGTPVWSARGLGPSTQRMRLLPGSYTLEATCNAGPRLNKTFAVATDSVQVDLEP